MPTDADYIYMLYLKVGTTQMMKLANPVRHCKPIAYVVSTKLITHSMEI